MQHLTPNPSTRKANGYAIRALFLVACALYTCNLAWAQTSAARVMAVTGYAKIMDTRGNERNVEKGTELFAGDKILTSDGALVQLRLNDGGYMSVRPSTELVIDQFVHDEKEPSNSSFLATLLRGGFRSITGLIGRNNPKGYQIRSATATIGIRGTDHEPMVVLDTPGMHSADAPGLYDKVNDGETFISSRGGVLALRRGDIGFVPFASDTAPKVMVKVPDFYKIELKTDARDPKDGPDKDKGAAATNNGLMRPSLADRRNAQQAADNAAAGNNGQTNAGSADAAAAGNGNAAKAGNANNADPKRAAAAQAPLPGALKADAATPGNNSQGTTPSTTTNASPTPQTPAAPIAPRILSLPTGPLPGPK